jgi:hypothetical protein
VHLSSRVLDAFAVSLGLLDLLMGRDNTDGENSCYDIIQYVQSITCSHYTRHLIAQGSTCREYMYMWTGVRFVCLGFGLGSIFRSKLLQIAPMHASKLHINE